MSGLWSSIYLQTSRLSEDRELWNIPPRLYHPMLKFHLRGVLRKIQDFLIHNNDFDISVKGIHDMLLRVGDACKK